MAGKAGNYIHRIVAMLLVATMLTTSITPISYASERTETLPQGEPICGFTEHMHTQELCYKEVQNLICALEETEGHSHTKKCYDTEKILVCDLDEGTADNTSGSDLDFVRLTEGISTESNLFFTGHKHTGACYERQETLICNESEQKAHVHMEQCYTTESMLQCILPMHIHTESCYAEEKELTLIQQTLTTTESSVSVSGILPEGAALAVRDLTDEEYEALPVELDTLLFAYDITILVDGEVYQPETPVTVTVVPQMMTYSSREPMPYITVHHVTGVDANGEMNVETVARDAMNDEGTVTFTAESFSVYYGVMQVDEPQTITFDLAKGNIAFTDSAYSGFDENGDALTGNHNEANVYVIKQSNYPNKTSHTIKVGDYKSTSDGVTKDFVLVLDNVYAEDSTEHKQWTMGKAMLYVHNKETSTVAVILKDNSNNILHSGTNRAGLEKGGGKNGDGTLVVTCEAGYAEWLNDPDAGHTTGENSASGCTETCGSLEAASGNAWWETYVSNSVVAAAGIGTPGGGSSASTKINPTACKKATNSSYVSSTTRIDNSLRNLTIAGGKITAIGARGSASYSGDGPGIGAGACGINTPVTTTGGDVQGLKFTGGTIVAKRGGYAASGIGAGYRGGFVSVEIFGGTIEAGVGINKHHPANPNQLRGAGIGGAGGGYQTAAPEGATVTIHGGDITAYSQYGAAIGAGAGGSEGNGSDATVNIYGGNINARTEDGDGDGAGAAIGTGGSLGTGKGGIATVNITGGTIVANSELGADIGGGGTNSTKTDANGGEGTVNINGGNITAQQGGIGGGRANAGNGGDAIVEITGGTINAFSIGGGNSISGTGGEATVTVKDDADITLTSLIGGGNSTSGAGGNATVNVINGTLRCASIGGGDSKTGTPGTATVDFAGGTIITGYIGGGVNDKGDIGKASAEISGGNIQGQFIMSDTASTTDDHCTFEMRGGTIDNKDLGAISATGYARDKASGGAVYMDDPYATVTISGGTIRNCTGEYGGAVYMTAGTFTLSGTGKIQNCVATGDGINVGKGGAIYLAGGDATISGGTIGANDAPNSAYDGGGAYLAGGQLDMNGGSLAYNIAANNGGGAYVAGGDVNVTGGDIHYNTANKDGGGIYVKDGNVIMSGGMLSHNKATNGAGGAMYVASEKNDVDVTIYSGTLSGNTAKTDGGAVAVVGKLEPDAKTIHATIGLHEDHYFDSDGTLIPIDHTPYKHTSCPIIENNNSGTSGGAIYVNGNDMAQLDIFCLKESNNSVGNDEDALSNFMMVNGGKVIISAAENHVASGEMSAANDNINGAISVDGSMHVVGGKVDIYGATTNPTFSGIITVDVPQGSGAYFEDHRYSNDYYKLLYYENFKDPVTGEISGQYKAFQIPIGDTHEILGVIYSHDGYKIDGWNTDQGGNNPNEDHSSTGDINGRYNVGVEYIFDGTPIGDLTLYAIWDTNGYFVDFNPNVPQGETYSGTMEPPQSIAYDATVALNENKYHRIGYKFIGWNTKADGTGRAFADKAPVTNLTDEDGATVVLYAQWEECNHDSTFTYTSKDGLDDGTPAELTRHCSCGAYSETATLTARTTTYDGDEHPAVLSTTGWNGSTLSIDYTKGGSSFTGTPKNAGTYIASISDGDKTAKVEYTIEKASQPAPTEKPTYTEPDTGSNILKVQQIAETISPTTNAPAEYAAMYYDIHGNRQIVGWTTATGTGNVELTLPEELKVYFVYVRYQETENYLASDEVMADALFFFENNISLKIVPLDGIEFIDLATDTLGRQLIVALKDGYYLPNGNFDIDYDDKYIIIADDSDTSPDKGKFLITSKKPNPESPTTIVITVGGAVKETSITAIAAEKQIFNAVRADNSIDISGDSAFTAYFDVTDYDASVYSGMKLVFDKPVPKHTTIILQDKTNPKITYWHYTFKASSSEVSLNAFEKMGTNDNTDKFIVSGSAMNYQFIVDFSRAQTNMISFKMSLATIKKTGVSAPVVSGDIDVACANADFNLVEIVAPVAGLSKEFHLSFTPGGAASKWDNRTTALVLTPKGNNSLPFDARLKVTLPNDRKTEYTLCEDGKFIIPIAYSDLGDVKLELVSDLFPAAGGTYDFALDWKISNSISGYAPVNGYSAASIDSVEFNKAEIPALSLRVDGRERLYTTSDRVMNVKVTYVIPDDYYNITAELLKKGQPDASGAPGKYTSTGWKPDQEIISGENLSVSLGGQTAGSYCLMLIIKDNTEKVLEVPYYFIVDDSATTNKSV